MITKWWDYVAEWLLVVSRAIRWRCVNCGKGVGDESRYGHIQYVIRAVCNECWGYGESE